MLRQATDLETVGLSRAWRLAARVFRQAVCIGISPGGA